MREILIARLLLYFPELREAYLSNDAEELRVVISKIESQGKTYIKHLQHELYEAKVKVCRIFLKAFSLSEKLLHFHLRRLNMPFVKTQYTVFFCEL